MRPGRIEKEGERERRPEPERRRLKELQHGLEEVAERVATVKRTDAEKAEAHLSRDTRKALRTVREVLWAELDEDTYRSVVEKINDALKPGKGNAQ